jgi:ethanolamine ammonia-lyase small subunit
MSPPRRLITPDPWTELRAFTRARIALGRAGGSLPTAELLAFSAAQAAARDAVWTALDLDRLAADLEPAGLPLVRIRSQAADRATYLQRPDLGRRLDPACEPDLATARPEGGCDLAVVVADGLSAAAAQLHAPALVAALAARLRARGLRLGPAVLALQARVALEDPIGAALGARAALILLGERPGLGSPDSLGAYLVFDPRPGRTDAQRNCVSNIRPEGFPPEGAAEVLDRLAAGALRRGLSGVALKDERAALDAAAHALP